MTVQQDIELAKQPQDAEPSDFSPILTGGLKVFVQVPPYEARFEASILGCVAQEYVIVRAAASGKSPGVASLAPRVGDKLIVRFLVDGVAYGFVTPVIHSGALPEPLLFLHYPERIDRVSVRQHRRLPCRLPCTLVGSTGEKNIALLLDISEQGAKIAYPESNAQGCDAGTAIGLDLPLPAPFGMQSLHGRVVSVSQQGRALVAGVMFDDSYTDLLSSLYSILSLMT
ncbi:hypothetical protein BJI67_03420 [Acidihalobacter aeolianus]|uniref:PilZ domain-containing protein n=1 Tax=Acidihalobacter aeolianus TaxID=2792603 RepID=A0A1D8K5L0_9GAMM|nr:flagellar brake protein [Acidihalobacter aeolianus]AOV16246.1 hypothetical protein BJI67_03420 [Acidihalobacter aeolianus]